MIAQWQQGALEGLRVIDLTQMLAGPFCTMMLADQGAEVIKIEPLDGDGTREVGPFHPEDSLRAFSGYFQSVNRNKASIALDLKRPEAKDIFLKLIDTAQVVAENFRAGAMDRLGLSLKRRNPRIVYASIRGFGDPHAGESPYLNWPAFDVVAQAVGGIMAITGPDAATPTKVGPGVGDIVPAIMAAYGIMAAVWRTERSGIGQHVDVAMTDAVLAVCERILHQFSYEGVVPGPEGNRHPFLSPFGLVPAKDGFIALACHKDEFWRTLCEKLGAARLACDPRFATREDRARNQDAVYAEIGALTRRHTRRELMQLLGGHVPFGPLFDVTDIVADPHYRARDMVVELDHPGVPGKLAIAGVPVKLSQTPGGVRRRAPLLGEHTDVVMQSLGFSTNEVAHLRAANVLK
jgi:crotonobetainyl-CoA:carnitine CoA-transferase CaiB-like acyl-CoA transferase